MATAEQQVSPAPFDSVAATYDETFSFSHVGQAQRNAVWRHLRKAFRPGERILEIGCGTGVDACFLAKNGVSIEAIDPSSEMLVVASRRVQVQALQKMVRLSRLRAEDLGKLATDGPFDGAFSNFGALNCLEHVRSFAADLAGLLKPGARALLVWIGPHCFWEIAWHLARRNPKKAFRRFSRERVIARIGDGPCFRVCYPSVRNLIDAFRPDFRTGSIRGIGVTVPPSYTDASMSRHLRWLRAFEKADIFLERIPGIRVCADHILLEFQRRER